MKKTISVILAFCVLFLLCSCGNSQADDSVSKPVSKPVSIKKGPVSVVENSKSKELVGQLGTLSVNEVFEDIKNIDFYLTPDFGSKKYTVKTDEDKKNGTKDINYYSDGTLVYTKYEGYDMARFTHYSKTASGLDAAVDYYTDSGDNRTVGIKTSKYTLFANALDENALYGIADTNITLLSASSKAPFVCSAVYYYSDGTATFDHADYLENGDYIRYRFFIDQESKESETIKTLVKNAAPKISDDIVKAILTDKSYTQILMEIGSRNEWYCCNGSWYIKTRLCLDFDNKSQADADEYLKRNSLNGTNDTDGAAVVIDDVFLKVSESAILDGDRLNSFITEGVDSSFFTKITLDDNGMILKIKV